TTSQPSSPPDWPKDWLAAWQDPPGECRPLQIVHGITPKQANVEYMTAMRELGLGGMVCNVRFKDYLASEENWTTLQKAVRACNEAGLIVWIYDEQGYPSAAAGGLVLKTNPEFEALALTYDSAKDPPFVIRKAYEHSHASNNVFAARRYPNIIDPAAISCFIEKTHDAYQKRLSKYFGTTIKATFTDEPSLMAVNIGILPEKARKNMRKVDPVNPNIKALPSVPWVHDLPKLYRQRYNQDLIGLRRSLFTGNTENDRQVRQNYWSLIAELCAERYFGQLQDWCHKHNLASSGHTLHEESLISHVPLVGNSLKCLTRMDIPGLDMLNSNPVAVVNSGWLTASLPASAALLTGKRYVMTEVSDYSQRISGHPPATLAQMQATAAWQAAMGVTEFTLYYGSIYRILNPDQPDNDNRTRSDYRAYYKYVGRLNALLRNAQLTPRVLLYYPIYDLWAEYLPIAGPLTLKTQSPRAQQIIQSFMNAGRQLVTSQIPFALIDHELLATVQVRDKKLYVNNRQFDALVLPESVELPKPAAAILDRFTAASGSVTHSISPNNTAGQLSPACNHIILGRFQRDHREILLLVNVGPNPYQGQLSAKKPSTWSIADPATGTIKPAIAPSDQTGSIPISLPANSAIILVGPKAR
ncbi:MAG: hypothetical protein ACYTF1_24695, partial [Planctomycetota bacterium]